MPWTFYTPDGSIVSEDTPDSLPPGSMLMFVTDDAGAPVVPAGWLLADGSEVAQATYPDLFSAIQTFYNSPPVAVGNFRLPNLTGRFPRGASSAPGVNSPAGADTHDHTSLAHTHAITANHTHTLPTHQHTLGPHTHGSASHTHPSGTLNVPLNASSENADAGGVSTAVWNHDHPVSGSSGGANTPDVAASNNDALSSNGSFTTNAQSSPISAQSSSIDFNPANHLPPYLNVFFIIKT